jgi:hypothetical protein
MIGEGRQESRHGPRIEQPVRSRYMRSRGAGQRNKFGSGVTSGTSTVWPDTVCFPTGLVEETPSYFRERAKQCRCSRRQFRVAAIDAPHLGRRQPPPIPAVTSLRRSSAGSIPPTSLAIGSFTGKVPRTAGAIRRGAPGSLRVRPETSCGITELSEHQSDGGKAEESERIVVEGFPVLGQTAAGPA